MSNLLEKIEENKGSWEDRGYRLGEEDGKPVVEGDSGQFYCDAVANDCDAAFLMEHIRQNNPEEYARYRGDAEDDGIDLDMSQDVFVHSAPLKM